MTYVNSAMTLRRVDQGQKYLTMSGFELLPTHKVRNAANTTNFKINMEETF
jgi:hypothetical protein